MCSQIKNSILLIDDSTVDLRVLMEMMSAREMRVNVAFSGEDGYQKATVLRPELILLDVTMPDMGGFATCRMLKNDARTRHIPVIFLTAASEVDRRIEGLSLGAVDYICKPFHEQEVIARVSIHLDLARQRRTLPAQSDDADTSVAGREAALVRTAMGYLRQNLRLPPSPETLAKILGTNEKHLNQAFLDEFTMPVFTWLREERLRQARELLACTEAPISSIGEHVGYSNGANFAKAFRDRFGCSPRELRVELQREKQAREIQGN